MKEGMGEYREEVGPAKLYIDDQQVAEGQIRTILGHFPLCGEGLCVGYDGGDDAYIDIEAHLAAAMMRA